MGTKNTASNAISLNEKLDKINDSLTVHIYDNGYMLEISGRDHNGEWKNAKIVSTNLDELFKLIEEASTMERHD